MLELFRSFGSMPALLPIGGKPVWGNGTLAPDDEPQAAPRGAMITMHPVPSETEVVDDAADAAAKRWPSDSTKPNPSPGNLPTQPDLLSTDDVFGELRTVAPTYYQRISQLYDWSWGEPLPKDAPEAATIHNNATR